LAQGLQEGMKHILGLTCKAELSCHGWRDQEGSPKVQIVWHLQARCKAGEGGEDSHLQGQSCSLLFAWSSPQPDIGTAGEARRQDEQCTHPSLNLHLAPYQPGTFRPTSRLPIAAWGQVLTSSTDSIWFTSLHSHLLALGFSLDDPPSQPSEGTNPTDTLI
jgi:hypothetical protein